MTDIYSMAGMGVTFLGPDGVLIPFGLTNVIPNLTLVTQLYNYFSLFVIMLLAVSASQRDTRFISLLLPLWAGFCMLAGWLKYPDAGTGFGILVVCSAIAIMTYMHETVHERFGIAGPGNKVIKIFMFLIILQCVVVFVNSAAIFPTPGPIASNDQAYANIQLDSTFQTINNSGGLGGDIIDLAMLGTSMAISMLKLFVKCLLGIALFSVILSQIFPWIVDAGTVGVAFLVVIQFAIWGMYMLFVFTMFYRPSLDPGW